MLISKSWKWLLLVILFLQYCTTSTKFIYEYNIGLRIKSNDKVAVAFIPGVTEQTSARFGNGTVKRFEERSVPSIYLPVEETTLKLYQIEMPVYGQFDSTNLDKIRKHFKTNYLVVARVLEGLTDYTELNDPFNESDNRQPQIQTKRISRIGFEIIDLNYLQSVYQF